MTSSKFNLRNVFLVNAIVDVAFALVVLIGPETVLRLLRLSNGNTEMLMARLWAGALIALGVIAWFARDFTDIKARDVVAISLLLFAVIGFVVALLATLGNVLRVAGWGIVAVFLAFALSYGYLQLMKKGE
jgi:hypothetical protein